MRHFFAQVCDDLAPVLVQPCTCWAQHYALQIEAFQKLVAFLTFQLHLTAQSSRKLLLEGAHSRRSCDSVRGSLSGSSVISARSLSRRLAHNSSSVGSPLPPSSANHFRQPFALPVRGHDQPFCAFCEPLYRKQTKIRKIFVQARAYASR